MPEQAHSQTLLLLKGHPATGKSALALALAQRLVWPLIDKDDIKDYLYQLPQGNALSYEIMWHIVRHQLAVGLSVIVDSPLSYLQSYETGKTLTAEHGATLLVVETRLKEALWRQRLEERRHQAATHRVTGWAAMQEMLKTYADCWRFPIAPEHYFSVDTSLPTHENVDRVIHHLTQRS